MHAWVYIVVGVAIVSALVVVLLIRSASKDRDRLIAHLTSLGLAIQSRKPLRAAGSTRGLTVFVEHQGVRGGGVYRTRVQLSGGNDSPACVIRSVDYDPREAGPAPTLPRFLTGTAALDERYEVYADREAQETWKDERVAAALMKFDGSGPGRLDELSLSSGTATLVLAGVDVPNDMLGAAIDFAAERLGMVCD